MKTKIIQTKHMADYLIECGNHFLYTLNNRNKEGYNVFVFYDTPKLRDDMSNYNLKNKK